MKGQGATEYLVLLAVVLVIALVAIALLGFFPGMAGDAQETQSKAYWSGASPIAIVDGTASAYDPTPGTHFCIKIRNTGAYRLQIKQVLANSQNISQYYNGSTFLNFAASAPLSPGEEMFIGYCHLFGITPAIYRVWFTGGASTPQGLGTGTAPSIQCGRTTPFGYLVQPAFGFEYDEYIEGQTLTKRQIGKILVIKCGQDIVS